MRIKNGVVEKHDFCDIQQKIPQISDFAKKTGFEPPTPWGYSGRHCENVCKIFLQKSDFASKNTIFAKIRSDFCKIPRTLSRKLDSTKNFFHDFRNFRDFSASLGFWQKNNSSIISAKILFPDFLFTKSRFLRKTPIFAKNADFCKNIDFRKKSQLFAKTPIYNYFSRKTPIFTKMPIFAKLPIVAKI
jgi:hypothetical protein